MVQKEILNNAIEIMPYIMRMPSKHIWLDYDKEADIMYVSFEKPQQATDTEVLDNGMLIRKRNNKIVGLTLINASQI
ncbi:MAG: DUF2283 domain-containing protein [bacterium]